jgi:fructose-1-phosphate kinase PfkB-like protein
VERARGAVVVTHGTEGLVATDGDGRRLEAAVDARGRYPVGSGDACLAGMLTVLDGDGGWEEALRLGIGAAAANAEQPGAGRLSPARARELAAAAAVTGA